MKANDCGIKFCPRCKDYKDSSEFYSNSTRCDGLSQYCKECEKSRFSGYFYRNRRKVMDKNRRYFKEHPEKLKAIRDVRLNRINGTDDGTINRWQVDCMFHYYGDRCLCCGSTVNLEADHVIPLCKGGKHSIDNMQPLCKSCNSSKNGKHIDYRGVNIYSGRKPAYDVCPEYKDDDFCDPFADE